MGAGAGRKSRRLRSILKTSTNYTPKASKVAIQTISPEVKQEPVDDFCVCDSLSSSVLPGSLEETTSCEEPSDNNTLYEVSKIKDVRLLKGRVQYKIAWKGWAPRYDEWVNDTETSCPGLIEQFWENRVHNKRRLSAKYERLYKRVCHDMGVDSISLQKKEVEESDDDRDEVADVEVEAVLDVRRVGGIIEYLLSWKGYDSSFNEWIIEENVRNCLDLVKEFWLRVFDMPENGRYLMIKNMTTMPSIRNMRPPNAIRNKARQRTKRVPIHSLFNPNIVYKVEDVPLFGNWDDEEKPGVDNSRIPPNSFYFL